MVFDNCWIQWVSLFPAKDAFHGAFWGSSGANGP